MNMATVALDEPLTCPEPANWTFSQDLPDLSDITISSIGMDTEQACLSTGVSSVHVDAFQALQDSFQNYSTISQGWFILPNVSPNIIQLCTHEINRVGSPGINDEKFNLLSIKHNGKFFDCSGKLFAYT